MLGAIVSRESTVWNPSKHSDDDNLRWCWLRAIEWGNWPMFVSQPVVPIAILFWPWKIVVGVTIVLNILWALLIRYNVVILPLAYWATFFVRLKWLAFPLAAYLQYQRGAIALAILAILWPLIVIIVGPFMPPMVGRIQMMFMKSLGYQPTDANLL
jgi:hypothetical protein